MTPCAVAHPCDESSLRGAVEAAQMGLLRPILVGPKARIEAVAEKIAAERGRATRPDIKLGICGEHGGDPASIHFCEGAGLDYVSCSPFRVPIARLAAAQAALGKTAASTA